MPFIRYTLFCFIFILASMLTAVASNKPKKARHCAENLLPLQRISVATYNVENLFDPTKQRYKRDREFSLQGNPPWTQEKYEIKLGQIEKMIRSLPSMPQIIGVMEVENANALHHLAMRLGYKDIFINSSRDHRGINVGMLVKASASLQPVVSGFHFLKGPAFQVRPTRDILEMEFLVNGTTRLIVFVNHWPSQAAKSEVRYEVAKQLKQIIRERKEEDPSVNILVMGDMNTIPEDQPNALTGDEGLFGRDLGAGVFNVDQAFQKSHEVHHKVKEAMPLGTSFYPPKMVHNKLDVFGASSNLLLGLDGLKIDIPTYRIHLPKFAARDYVYESGPYAGTTIKNVARPYNFRATKADEAGFSDHSPLYVEIIVSGAKHRPPVK